MSTPSVDSKKVRSDSSLNPSSDAPHQQDDQQSLSQSVILDYVSSKLGFTKGAKDEKAADQMVQKQLSSSLAIPVMPSRTRVVRGASSSVKATLRTSMRSRKPLQTHLALQTTTTSAAATALSTVVSIDPTTAGNSQFTDFAAVFDEYRCIAARLRWFVQTIGTNLLPNIGHVVYDPCFKTALASVNEAANYGPSQRQSVGVALVGTAADPAPQNGTGLFEFKPKLLGADQQLLSNSFTIQSASPSQWQETSTSVGQVPYGYLKYFIPAQGAGTTITIWYLLEMDVEFRFRNN